jgi:PAS domain S-box-containing protein
MRAVFHASPIPTALTRMADETILLANPAWLELLGWREEEVVGRTLLEVGLWARPERHERMLERLRSGEGVHGLEEEVVTKAGRTRIVLASKSVVELDAERCFVVQIQDVTESRRLQRRLRESEERFRQVTETLQQGFWLRNVDPPELLYASPSIEQIFGIAREAFTQDPLILQTLIHPDDRPSVIMNRDALTKATDFEFRIIRPDGQTRWIRTRAEPVLMDDGVATRIAAVSEDVTDEHELREALLESEHRFRLLAENSTDVIVRASLDGTIQYISPACRTVCGYEPEEMVGLSGWDLVHPADLKALRADIGAGVSETADIPSDFRMRRRDGTYIWVESRTRTLRDPITGEPTELHSSIRDVSERKQAEAAIRRAKEDAEQANVAKNEFLSRMSHELRTPLHAILGFSELLATHDLRPDELDHLTQITRGGYHLLELINEVLDISRIERGELRLSLEPVHVGMLVSETLEMIAPLAEARALRISTPRPEELDIHVLADRQRLKQVLLNLLSNAVKYNREGGDVCVGAPPVGSESCRITVADTGPGIAPKDRERVFAAFDRLGAEASEIEGTGLGLTLVKRLVEAMGGAIGVESEVALGSAFWVDLSVVPAPAAKPSTVEREPELGAGRARRPARTVLLVEDNPSNIRLVEAILARRPEISLLVATQGGLALELAREHLPALVLLDLNLPDMSGEVVLDRLRRDRRTADLAVVAVSADATPGQIARLRQAGADDYLTKPFEIARFLSVIDGATGGDGVAADVQPPAGPLDPVRLGKIRSLHPATDDWRGFVDIFCEDSRARLDALAAAAQAGDCEAVWQCVHALSGSCNLVGAHRVLALLKDIGDRARGAREGPDEARLAALSEAYAQAEAALLAELDQNLRS